VIIAVHALLYSRDADAARKFFQDTLKLEFVDAGGGWPIFALPPTEIAVHPTETAHDPELYLVCDDVEKTVAELRAKDVEILKPVSDQGWGLVTSIRIPGDIELGLYEPRHMLAAKVRKSARPARRATRKAKAKRSRSRSR